METWKDVIGFEEIYEVSSFGNIRRKDGTHSGKNGAFLKKCYSNGYHILLLHKYGKRKSFSVHRLVASSFIGEIPFGYHINHKDGNKQNNHVDNLEIVTPSQNAKHSFANGLQKSKKGEESHRSIFTNSQVDLIREIYENKRASQHELSRILNVSVQTINNIVNYKYYV